MVELGNSERSIGKWTEVALGQINFVLLTFNPTEAVSCGLWHSFSIIILLYCIFINIYIPGLRRYPGEGKGHLLQCSGLENSMDCMIHRVAKTQTWLSNFHILFFLIIYLFYITTLYWFCNTLTWICHGYTCVPHPEPPSQIPPHPIPLDHPSAPAPSIPVSCIKPGLVILQCHSPISSNPCPLPQSLKDCSIYLSLSCCLAYRVIITLFLNSIYMR